jgi:hypothetical protein
MLLKKGGSNILEIICQLNEVSNNRSRPLQTPRICSSVLKPKTMCSLFCEVLDLRRKTKHYFKM